MFVGSYAFEVVLCFELLHFSSLGLMNHMNIVLKFLIVVFYYIIWSTDTPRVGHVPVFDTDTTCVRHRHDINTYDYIELCYFLKLLLVSTCPCRVRCPCLFSVLQFIFAHTLNYERWWQLCLFCSLLWLWWLQLWPT
jgi:hypothetical protein